MFVNMAKDTKFNILNYNCENHHLITTYFRNSILYVLFPVDGIYYNTATTLLAREVRKVLPLQEMSKQYPGTSRGFLTPQPVVRSQFTSLIFCLLLPFLHFAATSISFIRFYFPSSFIKCLDTVFDRSAVIFPGTGIIKRKVNRRSSPRRCNSIEFPAF